MNAETVAGLTRALIEHQHDNGIDGPVVIAQDTRPSGSTLRVAALAAAESMNVDVVDAGILPTPGAQKIAEHVGALATVVITASHNPWTDNGWKGMLGNRKPTRDEIKAISNRYWANAETPASVIVEPRNSMTLENAEATTWYTDLIVENITNEFGVLPLNNLLFVVDGARGAARSITPEVLRRLGARIETFCCDDQGYINDGCGATSLDGVKMFLKQHPYIVRDPLFMGAVANDGDADRLMAVGVDSRGAIVEATGNHIMELLATHPKQPGIVGTIYTNSGTTTRLNEQGIGFEYCDNGDVHVTNALLGKQADGLSWKRGGEFTGHLIDTTWLGSGDGVRMAAWLAAYAAKSGQTFGDIAQAMPMWPEHIEPIDLPKGCKIDVEESPFIQAAMKKVTDMGARPIVRASGTEPIVRVWCEAPDKRITTVASGILLGSVVEQLSKGQ